MGGVATQGEDLHVDRCDGLIAPALGIGLTPTHQADFVGGQGTSQEVGLDLVFQQHRVFRHHIFPPDLEGGVVEAGEFLGQDLAKEPKEGVDGEGEEADLGSIQGSPVHAVHHTGDDGWDAIEGQDVVASLDGGLAKEHLVGFEG